MCIYVTADMRTYILRSLRTGTKISEMSRSSVVIDVTIKKNVLEKTSHEELSDYWKI